MTPTLEQLATEFIASLRRDGEELSQGPLTPAQAIAALMPALSSAQPSRGDLWIASTDTNAPPVLCAVTEVNATSCHAVLVIDEVWFAGVEDIVVPQEDSPTGEPLMLCTWRTLTVPPSMLRERLGRFTKATLEALRLLQRHASMSGCGLRAIGIEPLDRATRGIRWAISARDRNLEEFEFLTGSAFGGASDPRRAVRSALVSATSHIDTSLVRGEPLELSLASSSRSIQRGRLHVLTLGLAAKGSVARSNRLPIGVSPVLTISDGRRVAQVELYRRDSMLYVRQLSGAVLCIRATRAHLRPNGWAPIAADDRPLEAVVAEALDWLEDADEPSQ